MLIVLLILSILFLLCGVIIEKKNYNSVSGLLIAVVGIVGVIFLIFLIGDQCNKLIKLKPIDDKIAMYEEENKEIENQIDRIVMQYMNYESETFEDLKNESGIALVSLYPELKADKLVQKQIEIHTKNNEIIKDLKCEKLNESIYKWWLYFGE